MKNQIIYSKARGYDLGMARALGLSAALVYGQLEFWNERKKSQWFYKSYDELVEELPLSKRSIQTARDILVKYKFIETKVQRVKGTPMLHFRILQFATFNVANSATSEMANSATSLINTIKNNNKVHSTAAVSRQLALIHKLYLKQFIIPTRLKNINNVSPEKLLEMADKRYKLSPKRRETLLRRLNDAGYDMICAAIIGYAKDPFYLGDNNRNWVADLNDFICHSFENVEKGANKYEQFKQGNNTNDPWANL